MSARKYNFDKIVKQPYAGPSDYTEEKLLQLLECTEDPLYFMKNFMKVQHPIKGAIRFNPYDYQVRIIKAFHSNRFNILLSARQMGKSICSSTIITHNHEKISIGRLAFSFLTMKQKVVFLLEKLLLVSAVNKLVLFVTIIQSFLWLIDTDHRKKYEISSDDIKKFTHIIPRYFESDFGYISKVFRTVPYEVWELKTETKTLLAADKHRVIRNDHSCAWLEDLVSGDLIKTESGIEKVISCSSLGIKTHMYCVQVNKKNSKNNSFSNLFYTDGILSHNTTCAAGYLLWKAMFCSDSTILITANKYLQALEIMDRLRFCYENLPDHIRAGVTEYNKGTIAFDNGSKIVSRATSSDAGRGLSISLLYCDEFAFAHRNSDFWTSIQPVLSEGGSCIITSTPKNDEDQFAQIWKGAIDNVDDYGNKLPGDLGKNGFFAISVPWWEHPERDEEWAKPFRESLGEARFKQEFENQFITDDETLINPLTLVRLSGVQPKGYTGTVRWYSEPQPNKTYMVGLDPSLGTGGDDATIQVFQLPEMVQVAEWQHNLTAPRGQMRILMQTLLYIDTEMRDNIDQHGAPDIFWTVENNSIGEAILQIIEDTGEDRFPGSFISEKKRKGVVRRFRKGMNTTNKSKLSACARLKSLIESGRMEIKSVNLIKQLKNFVAKENSFSAKLGERDDLVMALILIVRMLDIVVHWSNNSNDLKEYIDDDELFEVEPMPIAI